MPTEQIGRFRVSNDYLDGPEQLGAILAEEGYLFFRSVLDASTVQLVKDDFIQVLLKQGVVKPGVSEPVWTGANLDHINDDELYALDSYVALVSSDRTRRCL